MHGFANPKRFLSLARWLTPLTLTAGLLLSAGALAWGVFVVPPDRLMGETVRINPVAIAQGALTIRVTETPQVSQPLPFSNTGTTETVPRTEIEVDEGQDKKLGILNTGVSLQELVNGLNSLGIGPRDMITILQAIKAAGALNADIEEL